MKPEGMIAAARALRYWEERQEVASNNLANTETPGFKGERVFATLLQGAGGAMPGFQAATDFRPGAMTTTGNPLDLALGGSGFFVVETERGERLTRGGSFRLDAQGRITDSSGNALLGEDGPITVPPDAPGAIQVGADGTVSVGGKEVGRLRIESVGAGVQLQHEGANLFVPDPSATAVAALDRKVEQGAIEGSNVDTVSSLVDLVSIQRSYAAVQDTVKVFDGVMSTISNDLSRVV